MSLPRTRRLLLLMWCAALSAQAASFEVLTIGLGGASAAMGRSGVAVPGSLEGVFNNPASLASIRGGVSLLGSFNPYLDMSLWSAVASFTVDRKFTLAFGAYGLAYGTMTGDIRFNGDPGRALASGDLIASATLGLPLGTLLKLPFLIDLGGTAKYASQTLDSVQLTAVLFDAGALIGFGNSVSVLSLGFAAKNFGTVGGKAGPSAPTVLAAGAAWRLTPGAAFSMKLMADGETEWAATGFRGAFGAEIGLLSLVYLRGGYLLGADTAATRGFTTGVGARLRISQMQLRLDYAIVPLGELGGFQHNVQLGVTFDVRPKATPKPES
ncbi:MAG: hypothetical protein J0L75_04275 [Spirochaetes bacterium]|nr:hypothetical protein [Spirochaetota bacterium]